MIEIEITCRKCKEKLVVEDTFVTAIVGEIGIKVIPCDCTSEPDDCSECEDLKYLKNKLVVSEEEVRSLQVKLQNIQMFLDGGPGQGYQPDEASPSEDTNLPSDQDTLDPECDCQERGVGRQGVHLPSCPLHPPTDKNKPAQPNKPAEVQRHATLSDKDKPGQDNLQPTPDIESTGGYKIPGIKKNSAKGVVSDY